MTEPANPVTAALLGLHAQTPLHPGAGTALGAVDLPVQRERHTHWPTVAGSALKGILRDACRERVAGQDDLDQLDRFDDFKEGQRKDQRAERKGGRRQRADATLLLNVVFGPPTAGSGEFAGSLSVTDARLLAFPVRSLKGVFAWVSCNAVLERLRRDASLARSAADFPDLKASPNEAIVPAGCPCVVDGQVVLEEYDFKKAEGDATPVAKWLAERLLPDGPAFKATRDRFVRQFLILHDDDFTHFVRHATEISARIGLDYDTKTVKDGALFYQEFLPAESLFYSVLLANAARARLAPGGGPTDVLGFVGKSLPPTLQVGGDETTGKGYCATRLWSAR